MALETVNLYGCVVVATLTKIGLRCGNAVAGLAGMAIDAFLQTVFAGSHPPPERVVALVLEQLHVVAPHEGRVLDALTTTGALNHRLRHPRCRCLTCMDSPPDQQTKQEQKGTQSWDTAEPALPGHWCRPPLGGGAEGDTGGNHQSPKPIWM